MKVLFATTNPAKVKRYAKVLEKRGIEIITIKDLDTQIEVMEGGKTTRLQCKKSQWKMLN